MWSRMKSAAGELLYIYKSRNKTRLKLEAFNLLRTISWYSLISLSGFKRICFLFHFLCFLRHQIKRKSSSFRKESQINIASGHTGLTQIHSQVAVARPIESGPMTCWKAVGERSRSSSAQPVQRSTTLTSTDLPS